jgi:bla regulator protein BlaR1
MVAYIIQIVMFQLVFLAVYEIWLKRETFFNYNRAYLLVTSVLALVIPFLKFQWVQNIVPSQFVIRLPELNLNGQKQVVNGSNDTALNVVETASDVVTQFNWHLVIYLGTAVAVLVFVFRLYHLYKTLHFNNILTTENFKIVSLKSSYSAYSFFNIIFLGELISEEEKQSIIAHEKVHANQKHTVDLLWFELLKIVFWFNPLVYIYQHKIKEVHEFIADAKASKQQIDSYKNVLLNQLFQSQNLSFVNPFFKKSLIKNRLIMLSQKKSHRKNILKYSLILPLILGMMFYSSCQQEDDVNKTSVEEFQNLTDDELRAKYEAEFAVDKENLDFWALNSKYKVITNNYLDSRNEYYKKQIYINSIIIKNKNISESTKKIMNRTYAEYLDFKNTQDAKDRWQNGTTYGTLKMLVEDLDNITQKEQSYIDSKLNQIENDEDFTALVISDGFRHKLIGTPSDISRKQNTYDDEANEIPFSVLDQTPVFPNCDAQDKECFSREINKLVLNNFNTKLADNLNLSGEVRIITVFKINKNGDIYSVRARAPHPDLEEETKRVLNLMPRLAPAKHKGETVATVYSLPIKFQIK